MLVFVVALPLLALMAAIFMAALALPLHDDVESALQIGGMRVAAPDGARVSDVAEIEATRSAVISASPEPTQHPVHPPTQAKAESTVASTPRSPAEMVPTPWQSALDGSVEPAGYEKLAFLPFDDAFGKPGRDDLTPWFEATKYAGFQVSKVPSQFGQSGTIEGVGRLLCPWPEGAVLRFQLENFDGLKMHFWNGSAGATLIYDDEGNRWTAYKTNRDGDEPTPKTWAIAATDDDRCRRSGFRYGGSVELRFVDSELILSRGDVVLLAAPFEGRPTDVFFDGRATIHGIALARTNDAPQRYASQSVKEGHEQKFRPVELDWKARGAGGRRIERLADGAVRLRRGKEEYVAQLPETGLYEVVLELTDVARGAGVYLSDENREPGLVLRFCRDRKTGRLIAALRTTDQSSDVDQFSPDETPASVVESHCWVKLLQGCGNLRWWVSTDGVHWAQTEPAKENSLLRSTSIGLSLAADASDGEVTLKQISLRRLSGLQSLAGGGTLELTYLQLESILNEAQSHGVSFGEQLAALDDAALMCLDLRDDAAMKVGLFSRYVQLGLWAADHAGLPAWSSVRQAFHSVPVCSPLQSSPDIRRAVRWELVNRVHEQHPEQVSQYVDRLRLFHEHRASGLVDWAQWLAGSRSASQPKDSWWDVLIEELSKEAYNAVTELKTVLDGQSSEEAVRLIAAFRPQAVRGIAPAHDDKQLLNSIPVTIAVVLEKYPLVKGALAQKFAQTANLRIADAVRASDAAAIELAAVQFGDIPAVAEAQRWLADRSLTDGCFREAIGHYERVRKLAPGLEQELAPKLRLAAAMCGRQLGESEEGAIRFGEATVSGADFHTLVAEMRAKYAGGDSILTEKIPQAGPFVAIVRSRFDATSGERIQDEVAKRTSEYRVPRVDRQLAVTVDNKVIYVSNRFCVAAYDVADGGRLWQSKPLTQTIQRAHDWPLIPMRPVIHGERLFVRLLYSANPVLACFEKATGKLIWATETPERESFASDPLWIDDRMLILTMANAGDQSAVLKRLRIDPRTGDVVERRDLIRLRGNWWSRRCCQVAAVEGGLVATLGGVTLAMTANGDVHWIRKHITLPAEEDPRWILQMYERPLVLGERVFVVQPGMRAVECLDSKTGRKEWQAVLPEVLGIVGHSKDVVVVRTESDIRGLDSTSGQTRWRYPVADVLGFPQCDESNVLVATSEATNGSVERRVRLTWLRPADGGMIESSIVEGMADPDPRLGPIISLGDKSFAFFGRGQNEPTRDVVELLPARQRSAESRAASGGN